MLVFQRWICKEHPEVERAVGPLLHSYDLDKYESMANIVVAYNRAVRVFPRLSFPCLTCLTLRWRDCWERRWRRRIQLLLGLASVPAKTCSSTSFSRFFESFTKSIFSCASESDSL